MKNGILILIISIAFAFGQVDTTLELSFFPLHVGDKWEYRGTYGNRDDGSSSTSYFTNEVLRDTTLAGTLYFQHSVHGFVRIDTLEMMVYQFDPQTGSEAPFWDLVLEPGEEHPNGHVYEGLEGPFDFWGTGVSTYEKRYNNGQVLINEESYSYLSNIGFYELEGVSHGGWYWSDDLIAVRIDTTQYGTFSYPEDTLSGGFAHHIIYSYAAGANAVYAADVDGDGDQDVLSASINDSRILWHENEGQSSFSTRTITTEADGAWSVYAADIDGDEDLDILSASINDDRVAWYENTGSTTLPTHTIVDWANGACSVFATDIDGDGDTDVLSASRYDDRIIWYENTGDGSFLNRIIHSGANNASDVYAADVDGDGDVDILSASTHDNKVAWYENVGTYQFPIHVISTGAVGASSVYATDVDGDGDMDVLSASYFDDRIAWYENDGTNGFTTHTISDVANGASSVFAADMDNDGDLDVLSASAVDSKIAWYENEGSNQFIPHILTYDCSEASSVFACDLDGDGDQDILTASKSGNQIAWYENLTITGLNLPIESPVAFRLEQNYPNPFNPETTISFHLPHEEQVRLTIHDLRGRELLTLVNEERGRGVHTITWDAGEYAGGVYFYRLKTGTSMRSKKMLLLK